MSSLQRQLIVGIDEDDTKASSDVEQTPTAKGSFQPNTTKTKGIDINIPESQEYFPTIEEPSSMIIDNNNKVKTTTVSDNLDMMDIDDTNVEDMIMGDERIEQIFVEDLSSLLTTILDNMANDDTQESLSTIEPFDKSDDLSDILGYPKAKKQAKKRKRIKIIKKDNNNKKDKNNNNNNNKKKNSGKKKVIKMPSYNKLIKNESDKLEPELVEELLKDMTYVKINSENSSIGLTHKKFNARGGFDPWYSAKDVSLQNIGKKGGIYIKQDIARYGYTGWDDAMRDQSSEWKWESWLDPSAAAKIIHPPSTYQSEKPRKIIDQCPTKMNLGKEYGKDIEFIYMSPPWKTNLHGNGVEGYFTIEHLKALDFSEVQSRGFIFMWICWADIVQIINIFDQKGYEFADSCSAMLATWSKGIEIKQRVPGGTKPKEKMSGTVLHGVLFKRRSKTQFRIGNQIICDCFFYRAKTDRETGQHLMDHGYVYQMYQYLIVNKYPKNKLQALHLWCGKNFNRNNWAGVHNPKM